MNDIKKLIQANYFLTDEELFIDPYNRLWIHYDVFTMCVHHTTDGYYFSVTSRNIGFADNYDCIFEEDDVIVYLLLKYCKEVHKWGEYSNSN